MKTCGKNARVALRVHVISTPTFFYHRQPFDPRVCIDGPWPRLPQLLVCCQINLFLRSLCEKRGVCVDLSAPYLIPERRVDNVRDAADKAEEHGWRDL